MAKMDDFTELAADRFLEDMIEHIESWEPDDTIENLMDELGIEDPTDAQGARAQKQMEKLRDQFVTRVKSVEPDV